MSRRTLVLILLLVVATGLLGFLAFGSPVKKEKVKTPTLNSSQPTPLVREFTTLVASPSANAVSVGEETSFSVIIDTGGNTVASTQLEMVFNPEYFRVTNIEPLTFLDNPTVLLNEIDNKEGTISYALGTTTPKTGRGELAKITLVAKKTTNSGSTPITFLPKTAVGEIGNPASVLKNAVGPVFVIR